MPKSASKSSSDKIGPLGNEQEHQQKRLGGNHHHQKDVEKDLEIDPYAHIRVHTRQ